MVDGNSGLERSMDDNPCLEWVVKVFQVAPDDIDLFYDLCGKQQYSMVGIGKF